MILIYSIYVYIYIYIEREGAIWYHLDAKEGRTFVQPCFMTLEGYTMVYPRDTVSSCMHRFSSLHRSTLAHTKKTSLYIYSFRVAHFDSFALESHPLFHGQIMVPALRTQGGYSSIGADPQELFLLVIQDKKIQRLMDELDLPPDRANLPRDGTWWKPTVGGVVERVVLSHEKW